MKPVFRARQAFALYAVLLICFAGLYLTGLEYGRVAEAPAASQGMQRTSSLPDGSPSAAAPVEVFDDLEQLGERPPGEDTAGEATLGAAEPMTDTATPAASDAVPAGSRSKPAVQSEPSSRTSSETVRQEPDAARSPGQTRYTIQVAAHSKREEAEQTLLRLEDKQFIGRIRPPQGPGDSYFRVWVGDFGSREESRAMEDQLKEAGFLTYLRKIE